MKQYILFAVCLIVCACALSIKPSAAGKLQAGVAKINATLPLGVPLAGFNWGPRRVPDWPIPVFRKYTTWMEGNVGHLDPNWVKAAVIDNGVERFAFVTMDAIGADGNVAEKAYLMAVQMGFTVRRENVIFSASHTHSGPGAISPEFLWAVAPAVDLLVPSLQDLYCGYMAEAMVRAEQTMEPAMMDIGVGTLIGVTQNRRGPNPWVQPDTIDPHLGVIRVDDSQGNPIVTLWNYATHGTCYGPHNMKFTSDIPGAACDAIEDAIGGVAMFLNADAGDIDPTDETCGCTNGVCQFPGAQKFAQAVKNVHDSLKPTNHVIFDSYSQIVPFGPTILNFTFSRIENCTRGGPLDICTICMILKCDANLHLPESWVEQNPRFTAFSFNIHGVSTVMVTMPGEPLLELGWWVRNDTLDMGFDQTFLLGYSNNHMGYFATPNEYNWGGYESELSFWGEYTAVKVRDGCKAVTQQLKPAK